MSTETKIETVIPVGAVHGLVALDALNWKVVRRTTAGSLGAWGFVGYHRTVEHALAAIAQAEVAAGCVKVETVTDLLAAVQAATAVVAAEIAELAPRLAKVTAEREAAEAAIGAAGAVRLAAARAARGAA